jgi:opacity protein-like surface antigen
MKRIFYLSIVLASITGSICFSQKGPGAIQSTIGIGPRLGYYKSTDAEEGSLFFGAQARIRMGAVLGIEGALEYRNKEQFNVGLTAPLNALASVSYIPATLSALIFIPLNFHFAPYAVAGVGWYYTIVNYDLPSSSSQGLIDQLKDTKNSSFGYHFGLGVEIPFSRNLAINIDYRYLFLGSEIKNVVDEAQNRYDTKSSDGSAVTGSVMLYF